MVSGFRVYGLGFKRYGASEQRGVRKAAFVRSAFVRSWLVWCLDHATGRPTTGHPGSGISETK